jgi:RNA polymerase sigma-70 factor (ECF subfamily)
MVALAFRMVGNLEEARDQAQEAFVRLWQHHNWPEDENARFALLTRILINLCIDRLRKRKRHPLLFWEAQEMEPLLLSSNEPERELEAGELQAFMTSCLARLKPRQKAIFILRDVEGYSVLETAKIIGCSENNVLVNLHKARKNLRKWLAPYLRR